MSFFRVVFQLRNYRRILRCVAVLSLTLTAIGPQAFGQENGGAETDPVTLFNRGQDLHEKGDLKGAIDVYKQTLKLLPEFPEAELQLGNAYSAQGNFEDAESAFRRAVKLREDWTLALASLGSILVTNAKFTEAEPILLKAIKLDELNFPAYAAFTELRIATNSSRPILRELHTTISSLTEKAKPPAAIWAARGALENALGDHPQALSSAARALQIDRESMSALMVAAAASLGVGDPTGAEEYVTRIEAAGRKSNNTQLLRAQILAALGRLDDASALIDALPSKTKAAEDFRERLRIEGTESAADLEKRLVSDPTDTAVLGRLCNLYRASSPPKAMQYCRSAYEREPGNISHAIGFAGALVQAKLYLEAVTLLREISKASPNNSTVRANLGTALFQLKRYPEAKAEFIWLIERQPNLTAAYYFLAISHDHLNEYLDAMANYQEYLRRADPVRDALEIDRIKLRLPTLQRQLESKKGK